MCGKLAYREMSFASYLLAVAMPLRKVCLQCKAAVPVSRKTCEECMVVDHLHVFTKQSDACII